MTDQIHIGFDSAEKDASTHHRAKQGEFGKKGMSEFRNGLILSDA